MSLRTVLNEKPVVVWAFLGIALVVLLAMAMAQRGGTGGETQYFFDLSTGTLVERWSTTLSPDPDSPARFTYPDGEAGSVVLANIFGCPGQALNLSEGMTPEDIRAAGGVLASLTRYPLDDLALRERKKAGEELSMDESTRLGDNKKLVSDATGANWYPEQSGPSMKLLDVLGDLCGSEFPVYAKP